MQIGEENIDHPADDQSVASEDETSDEDDQCDGINLEELPNDLAFHTKLLLESSPLIKMCVGKLVEMSTEMPPIDQFIISGPAHTYISIMRDKFPKASIQLIERLGEANWQRHYQLRFNEQKIKEQVPEPIFQSTFQNSSYQSRQVEHSRYARSAISARSHSSFKSLETESAADHLRVPPIPDEVADGSQACPYCGNVQPDISSRIAWKCVNCRNIIQSLC